MKRDFNAPIGDKETGPSTIEEIEEWVVDYRAAISENYEGLYVDHDGHFSSGLEDAYEVRIIAYPLLFGLFPVWSLYREVRMPSDVERMKRKLLWYYKVKLIDYVFTPRH